MAEAIGEGVSYFPIFLGLWFRFILTVTWKFGRALLGPRVTQPKTAITFPTPGNPPCEIRTKMRSGEMVGRDDSTLRTSPQVPIPAWWCPESAFPQPRTKPWPFWGLIQQEHKSEKERSPASMLLQTFRDSKANTTTAEAKAGPGEMSKNIKK